MRDAGLWLLALAASRVASAGTGAVVGTCAADGEGSEACKAAEASGAEIEEVDTYKDKGQCMEWARRCECEANPTFMVESCAKSCKVYGQTCEDVADDCGRKVSKKDECSQEMWDTCARSCSDIQKELEKKAKECKREERPGGVHEIPVGEMFGRIADRGWAAEHEPKVLSRDPWIMYFDKFLTVEQVDNLMQAMEDAGGKFSESFELSTTKANARKRRTSDTLFCPYAKCFSDPRILEVHSVITNITGLDLNCHELAQVVRYRNGQYYVTHQDTSEEYAAAVHGHRIYTLFAYLTDLPEGSAGETHFPKLGLKVAPKKGAAVLWTNVIADNPRQHDPRTNHEAVPTNNITGPDGEVATKIAANLWLYGYDWRNSWKKGCMNLASGY